MIGRVFNSAAGCGVQQDSPNRGPAQALTAQHEVRTMYTRKQINAFRDSIKPGDRLVITERGWWRGDGGDPDQYQRVTAVHAGRIVTESWHHPESNEGFGFSTPKLVGDVVDLTDDSIVYETGPRRYRWGFRVER